MIALLGVFVTAMGAVAVMGWRNEPTPKQRCVEL